MAIERFLPIKDGVLSEQPARWIHRIVIAFVILCCAYFVPSAVRGGRVQLAILAAPLAALGVLALLRSPTLGFLAMVPAALLIPFSIGTGTETSINLPILLTLLMLVLWFYENIGWRRRFEITEAHISGPLLVLMLISIVSFGFGQIRWLPSTPVSINAQLGGLAMFILLPGLFLLTLHTLRDMNTLKWMTFLFVGLGAIFAISMLHPISRRFMIRLFQRAVLDSMFWTWFAAITFSQSLVNHDLKPVWRVLLGISGLIGFYYTIVILQSWTSGWLPALAALLTMLFVRKPRWIIAGFALLSLVLLVQPDILDAVFLAGDNEYSLETRLEAWRIIGELVRLNPLLGLGPANYYGYTPLFDIQGFSVRFNSHNNYVDIVAQIGIVGLICFILFAWKLFWVLWRGLDTVPEGFPKAYMLGALGGLVGTLLSGMLGDWFLPFVYNIGLEGFRSSSLGWMFLGAAVALPYFSGNVGGSSDEDKGSRAV